MIGMQVCQGVFCGSKVKMTIFLPIDDTVSGQYNPIIEPVAEHYSPKSEQVLASYESINGQTLLSNINITKQSNDNKQPKDKRTGIKFFKEKGSDAVDAKKFFEYYDSQAWHTGDKTPVHDWKTLAISRIERSLSYCRVKKKSKRGIHSRMKI